MDKRYLVFIAYLVSSLIGRQIAEFHTVAILRLVAY